MRYPVQFVLLAAALATTPLSCSRPAGVRYTELPRVEDGALHIVVFDVGQADAMLIRYRGRSLLIDAGAARGDKLRAVDRIPPRLDALLGSRHLDYFMVSHYHADHVGMPGGSRASKVAAGVYGLIEESGVTIGTLLDRGFWTAGKPNSTQRYYREALPAWLERGVVGARREVHVGERIDLGEGLSIEVLAASGNGLFDRLMALYPDIFREYEPNENDYSVALKLRLGEFEMFTAGDLTGVNAVRKFGARKEAYTDVESHIAGRIGGVELYRVNHHGSGHSTNPCFAQVLQPQASIFSTGENSYGHPSLDVYRRLEQYGDTYITGGADRRVYHEVAADVVDDDVDVVVASDGGSFWINGKRYTSRTDAEEAARPSARANCDEDARAHERRNPYLPAEGGDGEE